MNEKSFYLEKFKRPKLGGLLLLNIFLLTVLFGFVTPWLSKMKDTLLTLEATLAQQKETYEKLVGQTSQTKENLSIFSQIKKKKYLDIQDRAELAKFISTHRFENKISHITYTILPESVVAAATPADANFEFVSSGVTLDIRSYLDEDALNYLDIFEQQAPGQMMLQQLTMTRSPESIEHALDSLTTSQLATTMTTKASYSWLNLRAKETDRTATP